MTEIAKLEKINALLENIEAEKEIEILLAVESGSRAWGFPSKDSDYDIRIIYRHAHDWYVTPFEKKKVIENIFEEDLDVSGWDVSKCLALMYKGNASISEWLLSPVVYRSSEKHVSILGDMDSRTFNPKRIFHHYLSLAKRKLEDDVSTINAKSFLYALRALLCAKWVAEDRVAPPVEFRRLFDKYIQDSQLVSQLEGLLEDKLELQEGDEYLIPKALMEYALSEYKKLSELDVAPCRELDMDVYDQSLRRLISDL